MENMLTRVRDVHQNVRHDMIIKINKVAISFVGRFTLIKSMIFTTPLLYYLCEKNN